MVEMKRLNRLERIEHLKQMIDEARANGFHKIADLWAVELEEERKEVDKILAKPEVQALIKKIAEW